jgi:pilin isopeptide linkage protein
MERKQNRKTGRLTLGHRALALLLAVLMVFTMSGMQVFAEDGDEPTETQTEEAQPVDSGSGADETSVVTIEETTPAATTVTTEETTSAETTATTEDTTPADTSADTTVTTEDTTPAATTVTTEDTTPAATTTDQPETTAQPETTEQSDTTLAPLGLNKLIEKSEMTVTIDGTDYTLDTKDLAVPQEAAVNVTLTIQQLKHLQEGQVLTYQIPDAVVAKAVNESDNKKLCYTSYNSAGEQIAIVVGTYTISGQVVTIKLDEGFDYLGVADETTGVRYMDLPETWFSFTGNLSSELNADNNTVQFGSNVSALTIPFATEPAESEDSSETETTGETEEPTETPAVTETTDKTEEPTETPAVTGTTDKTEEPTETPAVTGTTDETGTPADDNDNDDEADTPAEPASPVDLSEYISGSAMNYYPDGVTPTAIDGETVTSGAYVDVTLTFGAIEGLEAGQTLVYQIPEDQVVARSGQGTVYYYQKASTGELVPYVVGTYTVISGNEKTDPNVVTITPDESYLNAKTGKIDLPGGQFSFSGNLYTDLGIGEQSLTFGKAAALEFTTKAVARSNARRKTASTATSNTYDLTEYIADGTYIQIETEDGYVDLTDLIEANKTIPAGSGVKVYLDFESLHDIEQGQTLVYKVPEALVVQASSSPTTIFDSNTNDILGSFVIGSDGVITVTIKDSYFNNHKDQDGNLDIHGFNLYFWGSFSSSAGQHEGSDDNVIKFSGSSSSTDISFKIPFDYINDHANVQISKDSTFDVATRTIHYTVTVTAPTSNTAEAYNVKVTDEIFAAKDFIEADDDKDNEGNLYRNYEVDNGTFDPATGVWTIDGTMKAGQSHTLTYDLVVTKAYYTDNATGETVGNTATVTFNDSGEDQAVAYQPSVGAVLVNKDPSDSLGEDTKGTYITYTLTATAYRTAMSGIVVSDAFTTPDYVSFVEADSASQGSVKIGDDKKSLTWAVGDLEADQTATLTYRAYLDITAWESGAGAYGNQTVATKYVNNTAKVSVNNPINSDGTVGTGGSPIEMDSASTSTKVTKMWIEKDGSLNKDTGIMSFTIKVNSAPTTDRITSIWDEISGGTYKDGYITMTVYESSANMTVVDTVKIPVSKVKNDAGTRWEINLAKVPLEDGTTKNLSGRYYYVLTYDVDGSSNEVVNQAGVGIGDGGIAGVTKKIQGLSGWTKNTDYTKTQGTANYTTGLVPYTITLNKTVTTGFVVKDYMSSQQCYENAATWYDDDTLSKIVVKQGDTIFTEGEDYTVTGVQEEISKCKYDSMLDKYNRFDLTFLHDITASKSDPITISYNMKMDNKVYNEGERSGSWALTNYLEVAYMVNGVLTDAIENGKSGNAYYQWSNLPYNIPLTKDDGTYDPKTGTVSWTINANNVSTVGGSATLIDLLPEGLTFDNATIIRMGVLASNNKDTTATTMNGKGIDQPVTADDCKVETVEEDGKTYTKVSLSLENLSAFEAISGGKLVTDVHSSVNGTNRADPYGRVVIQITAKVDTEILASDTAVTLTNKAILTGNDALPEGGVSATGDVTIPVAGEQVMKKSEASTESPAYVQFALDINSSALDLVAGDGDLVVDDVMGEGMTLATLHTDCFKVYEVSKDADIYTNGSVDVSKVQQMGPEITSQCSWTMVSATATDIETSLPIYRFTVPDGKRVVIVYWASFTGVEGQKVSLANNAYFYYEGHDYAIESGGWSGDVRVGGAGGEGYTNPYFFLQKQDQWGNNVSGAVFEVDEYNRTTKKWTKVATRTTVDGLAYIGHETDIADDTFAQLKAGTIYRIEEIEAPAGYVLDRTEHYFEFVDLTGGDNTVEVTDEMIAAHEETHESMNVIDITPGSTYTVTNQFSGPAYQIPVAKTINEENLSSTVEFSFTLKQVNADDGTKLTVYKDGDYKVALGSAGLTTTIAGSGSTVFDALYFKKAGTYCFTLTEDALSQEALSRGYTEAGRDSTEYKVTVVVDEVTVATDENGKETKEVRVTSVTYSGGGKSGDIKENGDVPTFNNTLSLKGQLNLQVKKTVSGRSTEVQANEFSFNVWKDGEVIKGTDGNALVFTTADGGLVDITIPLTQEDIGDQYYIIKEVVPDTAAPGISYTASPVIASVTIGEGSGGKVEAISEISYTAEETDKSGVPLMVNSYKATGSITLTGTKILQQENSNSTLTVGTDQFKFTVKEGNTTVATGTTAKGGQINFTEIKYIQTDVGEHTYTITEDQGDESYVTYSTESHTVVVDVADNGAGKLTAEVTEVDGTAVTGTAEEKAAQVKEALTFTNLYTFTPPTGIRVDTIPYLLILVVALVCGGALIVSRRRRRHIK